MGRESRMKMFFSSIKSRRGKFREILRRRRHIRGALRNQLDANVIPRFHLYGTEPKPKRNEEPKPRRSEEPKPKRSEEPKPKRSEEPKPKRSEEPKPKRSEEPQTEDFLSQLTIIIEILKTDDGKRQPWMINWKWLVCTFILFFPLLYRYPWALEPAKMFILINSVPLLRQHVARNIAFVFDAVVHPVCIKVAFLYQASFSLSSITKFITHSTGNAQTDATQL